MKQRVIGKLPLGPQPDSPKGLLFDFARVVHLIDVAGVQGPAPVHPLVDGFASGFHRGHAFLPVGEALGRRRCGHFGLVFDAAFIDLERGGEGEDRLAVLDSCNPAGGEAPAIAQSIHLVDDGDSWVSGAQKIRVERMDLPVLHGSARGDQRLAGDLAAEYSLLLFFRAAPTEEIELQFLEVEDGHEIVEGFLHSGSPVSRGTLDFRRGGMIKDSLAAATLTPRSRAARYNFGVSQGPKLPGNCHEIEERSAVTTMPTPSERLRELLGAGRFYTMPCCFDALSARLIERAGFELTFMSGFAVSAARLALPDTGLISYGEMVDQGRSICEAVSLPVIGDADTGYGNALNAKRTVRGYAAAGFACAMIEDQLAPKRCGHTRGKAVVSREEAMARVRAAVDAREEGADILVMARTDARHDHGFDEALARCKAFADLGADITFFEAPLSEAEMERLCREIPGPKMANMVEQGDTPLLAPDRLESLGYTIAAYPLTLLSSAVRAMNHALAELAAGRAPAEVLDFSELREIVGFPEYDREQARYRLE